MRKSKFTEAQIVAVLQEGMAGMPVAEILRKHGISRPTYFNWKAKYGGTLVPELRRLKEQRNWSRRMPSLNGCTLSWRSRTPRSRTCCTENCNAVRASGRRGDLGAVA